jgi:hypothetical protein
MPYFGRMFFIYGSVTKRAYDEVRFKELELCTYTGYKIHYKTKKFL